MKKKHLDKHHRKPSSIGGSNDGYNISIVERRLHSAWHTLFSNKPAEDIAKIINEEWIDTDYIFIPLFIGRTDRNKIHLIIRKLQKAL